MSRAKPIVKKWARKLNKRVRTKLRKVNEAVVIQFRGPMVLTPEQMERMRKHINGLNDNAEKWLFEQYGFRNK